MAFLVPRNPLKPQHRLALDVDPAARIVRADELGAWYEARAAVDAAQAQADAIISNAKGAFEKERRRGHAEGTELARREGAAWMAEQLARTDQYFEQVEDRLVMLVMQAIRKIVQGYSDRDRVLNSVRNALAVVRNQKQITLRVHPESAPVVRAQVAELLVDYPGVGLVDVVEDARLGIDACVLESDIGVVEASTEGQLLALESAFRKVRGA